MGKGIVKPGEDAANKSATVEPLEECLVKLVDVFEQGNFKSEQSHFVAREQSVNLFDI